MNLYLKIIYSVFYKAVVEKAITIDDSNAQQVIYQ